MGIACMGVGFQHIRIYLMRVESQTFRVELGRGEGLLSVQVFGQLATLIGSYRLLHGAHHLHLDTRLRGVAVVQPVLVVQVTVARQNTPPLH